ncbi:hypothetical protein TELCIR_11339, partial [Teladorsagia circumcincta]
NARYKVLHVRCKDTGEEYAVKRALRTFESSGKRYRQLQEALNHEAVTPHPNIVRFEKAWEERQSVLAAVVCGMAVNCDETIGMAEVCRFRKGRFYIQTELCGANLQDYRNCYGPLTEDEQWTVITDTLRALERLHSEDMLHLDVKPSNIYLSLDNQSCKLGDFGLAINLKKKSADWADDGDKNYMAPELLNEPPTTAADMYSLGITMLELSTEIDVETKRQSISPIDKDYFLDKDWEFENEDVVHPPSLRMKRKYDCTAFGTPPIRKRLTFDELEEDDLPSPKLESCIIEHNTPVFTRILEFNDSPISPPPKKARGIKLKEGTPLT